MDFLSYFQLSLIEIYYVIFIVFIASIIRGFNGFGFSAICISGFSFILPAIEIVPIILALEVFLWFRIFGTKSTGNLFSKYY